MAYRSLTMLREQILYEGPHTVAAIVMEFKNHGHQWHPQAAAGVRGPADPGRAWLSLLNRRLGARCSTHTHTCRHHPGHARVTCARGFASPIRLPQQDCRWPHSDVAAAACLQVREGWAAIDKSAG